MKKELLIYVLLIFSLGMYAQIDSLKIGDSYWEDQLYVNVTYNILVNQPEGVENSQLSYGVGLGYNYDFYNQSLVVQDNIFTVNNEASSNRLNLHNLELPIQIRWRTSDAVTYSFWRVYLGVKVSYNLSNTFSYTLNNEDIRIRNIDSFNRFQTGLELSFGYGAFNFYTYYGLSTLYDDAVLVNETINTKALKLGLIFYLL